MDVAIILSILFFTIAVGFAIEYSRYLGRIKNEYERAKAAFNDIILSFSRELKRAVDELETVAHKVEAAAAEGSEIRGKFEALEGQMRDLEDKAGKVLEEWSKELERLDEVQRQIRDVVASQKELAARVSLMEEKAKQASAPPELGVETVIPIRRERALAHLTETELAVLEMLAAEGPKTAPEIKEKIKLSREHTARLMKKLYEEGYLERDASKIPFKYSVKKEMEKLLRKTPETA
ncbi:MAG: MarR family transcriptional regulator [Candidatus Bathyarchaeia archaeon]